MTSFHSRPFLLLFEKGFLFRLSKRRTFGEDPHRLVKWELLRREARREDDEGKKEKKL